MCIELASLIIEAMTDLVPDDRAYRSVVLCSVGRGIEERRLKNCRGKIESVLERNIERIDGLRRQPPFMAIDRPMKLRQLALIMEQCRTLSIAECIALNNP